MSTPELVATCWTSAGDVAPLDVPEVSPFPIEERVRAIADAGWVGIGLGQDDLRHVRDTIGFAALRSLIDDVGLRHVEVELASGWWRSDLKWRGTWELLLDASTQLKAEFIKIGAAIETPLDDITPLVEPLRRLADEAAAVGARVALEPLPFGLVGTIPKGAELIRAVAHPAAGLLVDYWHVFRADTTLPELVASLDAGIVFGVELSDAATDISGTLFEDTIHNRRLIGRGDQDVEGFIRAMREVGFDGPWGVEIISAEHRQRSLVDALTAAHDSTLETFARAES
ncbi:sugar phosphate isomerase/epimerase family protein [Microbacterium allomyrinae]|uniref:Sugar phosphate isomerase/epimerase n=1 Tax=Microbacterium allomyrinae TaxID=2830666 RepID=A0A9X1LT31_9MICO|nr:TIM barrel protein [Microbacterium allomyrinae]MCC2031549.1 sugar phosphate isomerase/epimerase [Microbacterium allomyrinae]